MKISRTLVIDADFDGKAFVWVSIVTRLSYCR